MKNTYEYSTKWSSFLYNFYAIHETLNDFWKWFVFQQISIYITHITFHLAIILISTNFFICQMYSKFNTFFISFRAQCVQMLYAKGHLYIVYICLPAKGGWMNTNKNKKRMRNHSILFTWLPIQHTTPIPTQVYRCVLYTHNTRTSHLTQRSDVYVRQAIEYVYTNVSFSVLHLTLSHSTSYVYICLGAGTGNRTSPKL